MKNNKITQYFIESIDKDLRKWRKPWKTESNTVSEKGCARQWVNHHTDAVGRMNRLLDKLGVKVEEYENAHYRKDDDTILMPDLAKFNSVGNYCATMFHELIHWTGTKDRCNRLAIASGEDFSMLSKEYAVEEIIAEMGSARLCKEIGLKGHYQQGTYVKDWLKSSLNQSKTLEAVEEKRKIIFGASDQADLAVEYIEKQVKKI